MMKRKRGHIFIFICSLKSKGYNTDCTFNSTLKCNLPHKSCFDNSYVEK